MDFVINVMSLKLGLFSFFKQVRLVVDRCEVTTTSDRSEDYSLTEDRRACEASSEIVGDKKYLNINAPLQLGGRANSKLQISPEYPEGRFSRVHQKFDP